MSRCIVLKICASICSFLCGFEGLAQTVGAVGQLRLQSSEYVSSGQTYFRDGAEGTNNSISLGVDTDLRWRRFTAELNARNEYSGTERWNYLNLYEANVGWQVSRQSSLTLGRDLERWNEWEGEWRQGLFQPRYMQNRLRSEQAGLIGLFFQHSDDRVLAKVGFLPLYVPDLGAHFYVQDDKFTSRNPWFRPPASQFNFRERLGEIRYSINKPEPEEVLLNPGGVGKVEFKPFTNYSARFSAAYKPMPALLVSFPSRGQVTVTSQEDFMNVRITPKLAYHTVLSHDSQWKAGAWIFSGSVAHEIPDRWQSPEDFTAQQAQPAWISALSVTRALEDEGPDAARVKAAFLSVNGGDDQDRGEFASAKTLFERRYQFTEAYMLALHKPWRGWTFFPIETELRLIYDRPQNGGVVSFSTGLNFTREFRADLELDFLGLLAGGAEIDDGFLAAYRANDRVGLGLSYVY